MPLRMHYSLRALGGKMGAQWERERRDTLFLMLPVLLSVLPILPYVPAWAGVAFGVLFTWRLALVLSGRWLPRASVRWVAALAITAAVYAQYGTLLGREPGVVLLVLFLGLKLMEMRARRDLFVVIFLCLFLLLGAFLHSQSMPVAALVALALYGLLVAMLSMQYRVHEARIGRRLRMAGSMLLQALPLAAATFVLFPRAESPLWGLPTDAHRARTGLSDSMIVGNIAELSRSDAIAFRVRFEGAPPPPAQLYWRGPVFAHFDGRVWSADDEPAAALLPAHTDFDRASGDTVRYMVTLEPTQRNWLFALEMPLRAQSDTGEPVLRRHDLQLVSPSPIHERRRYTVVSRTDWRAGGEETPGTLERWRSLPAGLNPRTRALAALWRAEGGDAPALVERALSMFRSQPFRYTLEPPTLGRNAVDEFLFGTRAGFCEHYASAFVVLMRALSIPARVVTGYQGGERNPLDGYWLVRQSDAHAWAEVWLAGRGWMRVDPTAAVAPERIERGLRLLDEGAAFAAADGGIALWRRLRFGFEAAGNAWNQWILGYDHARQRSLLAWLGIDASDWPRLAAVLAGVLAALLGAAALLTLRPTTLRGPLERCYDDFCARLAAVGLERMRHETPSRFVARIAPALDDDSRSQARRIVAAYEHLRYAVDTPDREAVRNLRRTVQAFKP